MLLCRTVTPADLLAGGSIVICGGWFTATRTSCIRLEPGSSSWVHHATISSRLRHTSWTAPSGHIILMAGYSDGSLNTTEAVGVGSSFALVRPAE